MARVVTSRCAPQGTWRRRCSVTASTARPDSSPGASRTLTIARARGSRMFADPSTAGASMPSTAIAGLWARRSVIVPVPRSSTPSSRPASPRKVSSSTSGASEVPTVSPATATSPLSSCSVASRRHRAVRASPAGPPNIPECTARSSIETSTTMFARPRRLVVSAGTSTAGLAASAITMTSAARESRCSASSAGSVGDPDSSSPSTNSRTPTGGRPSKARSVARWVITPALSSAAPRP